MKNLLISFVAVLIMFVTFSVIIALLEYINHKFGMGYAIATIVTAAFIFLWLFLYKHLKECE